MSRHNAPACFAQHQKWFQTRLMFLVSSHAFLLSCYRGKSHKVAHLVLLPMSYAGFSMPAINDRLVWVLIVFYRVEFLISTLPLAYLLQYVRQWFVVRVTLVNCLS